MEKLMPDRVVHYKPAGRLPLCWDDEQDWYKWPSTTDVRKVTCHQCMERIRQLVASYATKGD